MKASELRYGNFIQVIETKETIKCSSETIYQGVDGDFEGIPLTKEWLLKFGFEKSGEGFFFPQEIRKGLEKRFLRKESYNNRWKSNQKGWLCIGSWEGFNDIPINFVHQLQNLYFALTGEELELKP